MNLRNALLAALAALAVATPASAQSILIKGGRVVTNAGAILERGDVLITNGRIASVGVSITAPRDARVIDATGKWVTPGAFAAMSEVGLSEISGSGAPNDANIEGDKISAAADAGRAFDPTVTAVAVTRLEGVTRAAIAPTASGSMFSGRGALVSLDGGRDSVFRQRAFQVLELGETGAGRTGGSRAALWPMLEAALRDAREYPARYRSGQGGAVLNEIDAAALQPFARGEGLFLVHIESASDIRELIRFKRANPALKFVIHGGAEAWLVADELARAKIAVILDPLVNLPDRMERLAARADNAALLHRAGVMFAIAPGPGTVDAHQARLVLQLAGNAVANGLPWDAAFAAVSKAPADIFGVGGQLGSLSAGRTADVVVWDGDPLEVASAPTAVFIAGRDMPLVSRQTRLRDRYNPAAR
ncbi:MAG: amidohydrolase family protein [Hyphomonadaceae bacterium]|nr:MAG: amidohydrolase [Caulobacteraceae bacterium]MBT9445279.1 amidohydrolase family protein [Hyphomonadaceae bacterium]TPW07780.1 MAG: amidohydrolase [Alphaproteobacteria bacterium]